MQRRDFFGRAIAAVAGFMVGRSRFTNPEPAPLSPLDLEPGTHIAHLGKVVEPGYVDVPVYRCPDGMYRYRDLHGRWLSLGGPDPRDTQGWLWIDGDPLPEGAKLHGQYVRLRHG